MTTDENNVTVKGSPVKSLLKYISAELTPEQREQAYSNMPPDYASRFRQGAFLASETLPVTILNRLTEEAAKAKGQPIEQFARGAGRFAAGEAMNGVYRLFARVLTPTALLSKASSIWSSLYSRGELKVESQTDHSAKLMLVNFPSESTGCLRILGWIERMTELTGATARITHTQCAARKAPFCEWDIIWSDPKKS